MATFVQKVNSAFSRVGELLRNLQNQINTNGTSIQTIQSSLPNLLTKRNASTTPFQLQDTDSAVAGGNVRGDGAVDLQIYRTAANQVAAGANSFAAGMTNRAAQQSSIALGQYNNAAGSYSLALGGSNTTSAAGAVALGVSNNCSGISSFAGGQANVVSGPYATAFGFSNISNGGVSFAIGHFANTNTISRSFVLGFHNNTSGKAQAGKYGTFAVTTNASSTRTKCDGGAASATNQCALRANSCFKVNGHIIARDTSTNDSKTFEFFALIKMGSTASTISFVGTPAINTIFADSAASAWSVALVADTTNGVLGVNVTGEAGKTINWTVLCETVEVM